MNKIYTSIIILFFLPLYAVLAQPKYIMEHNTYHLWKKTAQQIISNDGKFIAYTVVPTTEGDAKLYVWNALTKKTTVFERGAEIAFSEDSAYLLFKIKPALDSLKAKKRAKVKEEDLPKDSLGILHLPTGQLTKIARVKSYELPQKWSGFIAFQHEIMPKDPKDKSKKKKETKETGTTVIVRALQTGKEDTFSFATQYIFAKKAKRLLVADTGIDTLNVTGVRYFDGEKGIKTTVFEQKKAKIKQIALDEMGEQVAFIADIDTSKAQIRPHTAFYWLNNRLKRIENEQLKPYFPISEHAKPIFSENGQRLFYGVAPNPIVPDTTRLAEETVNVEVWHYKDLKMHTQQKVDLENDKKRYFSVIYRLSDEKMVLLNHLNLPDLALSEKGSENHIIAYNSIPYQVAATWDGGGRKDIYKINASNGEATKIATNVRGTPQLSPAQKYIYWFNALDSSWFAHDISANKNIKLNDNVKVKFYDEENDIPDYPTAYGIATWGKDDAYILVYDRYDIWKIAPNSSEKPQCLTNGRTTRTIYRYVKPDEEKRFIEHNEVLLLHKTNEKTKAEGYSYYDMAKNALTHIVSDDFAFSRPIKAKNASVYLFSKQNFKTTPDLLYSVDFKNIQKISDINPQQKNYDWGSIELVEWTSLDGQRLSGLLVKPADFDASKKYPLLVNFYEKSSDQLHNYRGIEPHRSQINYSYYANRGYVIFNPDIPYRIGYPGESCYNALISGVTNLINKGFIDEKRIGVQGHSWGGYQVAYLITKTNLFKCAESGAPVVNMISAYGGVRWESGLVRQFQYEHTQSRIGGSLWEYPLRFMENSPIFSLDKVQTPVLILHNDKDGAVPWYQGIEFFTALRRLDKPCWLLNYNDEPHWPFKLQNRLDFQLRMQQFFDYYLKDGAMPSWMKRGVPAVEKGILQGFDD